MAKSERRSLTWRTFWQGCASMQPSMGGTFRWCKYYKHGTDQGCRLAKDCPRWRRLPVVEEAPDGEK